MSRFPLRILLLSLCLLLFEPAPAASQGDDPLSRATLTGLPGVRVVVADMTPDGTRAGLRASTFQAEVERLLRRGGIRILTRREVLTTTGHPYLYLTVGVQAVGSIPGSYTVHVSLLLHQTVTTVRNPALQVGATTWMTHPMIGFARARDLAADLELLTHLLVASFVDAYNAAKGL